MDPTPLVRERIARGEELVRRLVADGFPLMAACWAFTRHYERWKLYLVVPRDEGGAFDAVRLAVFAILDELDGGGADPFGRIGPFTVMPIDPDYPLAQGLLPIYRLTPDQTPAWTDWRTLGPTTVDAAYFYPATLFPTLSQPAA